MKVRLYFTPGIPARAQLRTIWQISSICADGSLLQMLVTPNPAMARRMASESPCWVPTFMRAGLLVRVWRGRGLAATVAVAMASAIAAPAVAPPDSCMNSRRFMNLSRSDLCAGDTPAPVFARERTTAWRIETSEPRNARDQALFLPQCTDRVDSGGT